jgi:regulatory protein
LSEDRACLRAEKTALRLIARAEQCSCVLARKLERRGYDSAIISAVISKLTEQNLLNDSRYARLWFQSRLRFARSPRRLLSALCTRGFNRDEAQLALKEVLNEEAELALLFRFAKKYEKKLYKAQKSKETEIRTLKFYLKSEGFSSAVVESYLESPLATFPNKC